MPTSLTQAPFELFLEGAWTSTNSQIASWLQ